MSYINTALKKAQREKDSRYLSHGETIGFPDAKRPRVRNWKGPAKLSAAAVTVVLVIIVGVGLYREGLKTKKDGLPAVSRAQSPKAATPIQASAVEREATQTQETARLYEDALKMQRSGQWKEAEILYDRILALRPQHVQALNNLGVILMKENRHDEAAELFVKAIAGKKDYVDPYYNLACLYARQNNVQASLRYLKQAAAINSEAGKWAKDDADLKNLHHLSEFKKITEELAKGWQNLKEKR